MVETSLETAKRLLNEALEECGNEECNFLVRTALQVLVAVQDDISEPTVNQSVLESIIEDDEELRDRLIEAGALDEDG